MGFFTITKLATRIVRNESSATIKLINIRSKGHGQGHEVQKLIEGDRVAGVSYALYRVPA